MSLNKQIVITLVLLITVIVFFGLIDVDSYIQDYFYDLQTESWMLDKKLQPYKFLFYDGLKKAIILLGVGILLFYIYAKKKGKFKEYHRGLLIVIISSILVPMVVGGLKKTTNMPCPHAETRYGGAIDRIPVWERYTDENRPSDHKECWPAGHASGGFALLSLYFLFKRRRNKTIILFTALTVGWTMGIYKMMVGDHFLSHTIITMMLAWLLILLTAKFVDKISNNKERAFNV
jgi:membrane-associated PAP2 superfamily phosphatase